MHPPNDEFQVSEFLYLEGPKFLSHQNGLKALEDFETGKVPLLYEGDSVCGYPQSPSHLQNYWFFVASPQQTQDTSYSRQSNRSRQSDSDNPMPQSCISSFVDRQQPRIHPRRQQYYFVPYNFFKKVILWISQGPFSAKAA